MIGINLLKPKGRGPGIFAWKVAFVYLFTEIIITRAIRKCLQEILEGRVDEQK